MFRKALALAPALLLIAPSAAMAGSSSSSYEALPAPAGKTVTMWRHVDREASTTVTCPPDSTKAFWCHARKVEAEAAQKQARQLSAR